MNAEFERQILENITRRQEYFVNQEKLFHVSFMDDLYQAFQPTIEKNFDILPPC